MTTVSREIILHFSSTLSWLITSTNVYKCMSDITEIKKDIWFSVQDKTKTETLPDGPDTGEKAFQNVSEPRVHRNTTPAAPS